MTTTSTAVSLVETKRLTFADLRNESPHEFFDVSSERNRTYWCFDGSVIVIDYPLAVSVSKSGHRVLDEWGQCWFIPASAWRFIQWRPREGAAHFVK